MALDLSKMVLVVWKNLKPTQFLIHNYFYSVFGPLMSTTLSVQDTLKEMSVPSILYLSELNMSWVCIQFFWVWTECTLSYSVQLSWMCHTLKHIQNWVKLNARVWVYQHIRPKTFLISTPLSINLSLGVSSLSASFWLSMALELTQMVLAFQKHLKPSHLIIPANSLCFKSCLKKPIPGDFLAQVL